MGIKRFFYDPSKRDRPFGKNRPVYKSSSMLSYTENDLAIMAKFTGNGKMAMAMELFEKMTPMELKMQEIFQSDRFKDQPCYPQTLAFGYILDFYFPLAGLAVELDGPIHDSRARHSYDVRRDRHLADRGIYTLRFHNEHVVGCPEKILLKVERKIAQLIAEHNAPKPAPGALTRKPNPPRLNCAK